MKRKDCTTKISNGSYIIHTRVGDFKVKLHGGTAVLYAPAGNVSGNFESMQAAIDNLERRGYFPPPSQ